MRVRELGSFPGSASIVQSHCSKHVVWLWGGGGGGVGLWGGGGWCFRWGGWEGVVGLNDSRTRSPGGSKEQEKQRCRQSRDDFETTRSQLQRRSRSPGTRGNQEVGGDLRSSSPGRIGEGGAFVYTGRGGIEMSMEEI